MPAATRRAILGAAGVLGLWPGKAAAQGEATLSGSDREKEDRARGEGGVTVWTTTDLVEAEALLAGFRARFPEIAVDYQDLGSIELYDRVSGGGGPGSAGPGAGGAGFADVVWSSAMDLQIKLVNDGHARRYVSPQAEGLPSWARWRDQAYGVTAEPIVFVHNRDLLPGTAAPDGHDTLLRALSADPQRWRGKVAAYDAERSGAGFLFFTQNVQVTERSWDLVRAMGQAGVKLYTSSSTMLDRVSAGDQPFAFDVIGSYAYERAKQEPQLVVVQPADYTLVMSRIAFIARQAPHPHAAEVFLDFLLSKEGQLLLSDRSLTPVRPDIGGLPPGGAETPSWRPIQLGPALLAYQDQSKRARFLRQWTRALQGR